MIGAGNIGVIVSYQLMQAGVNVKGIVEAAPNVGGYLVHAAKVRRAGVPIYTGHTIKKAVGETSVEKAVICQLDENWQELTGTEKELKVDTICLAIGLSPLSDILIQAGCQMAYVPQLGGDVAVRNEQLQTTNERFYLAGDVAGIEEATAAMLEGEMAGLSSIIDLGYDGMVNREKREQVRDQLNVLRKGPVGEKIRSGLQMVRGDENVGANRYSHCRGY
jgi:sarcosine oxidase subunit alpha